MNLVDFGTMDYEPDEIVEETTLTEMSVGLIKDSIRLQFKDPSADKKTDFVSTFIVRYHLTVNEISDDFNDEENVRVKNIHRDFISFMEDLLKKKLKIGIVDLEDMDEESQEEFIHQVYRFFIVNISQNMFNYVYRYIEKNKEALAAILPTVNSVTRRRMSDLMDDKAIIQICSNLQDVVRLALTDENITVDDFFEMCVGKDHDLELEFVKEKYELFELTGNFVGKYRKMLPQWLVVELESNILTTLVRKYRVREN